MTKPIPPSDDMMIRISGGDFHTVEARFVTDDFDVSLEILKLMQEAAQLLNPPDLENMYGAGI